MPNVYKPLMGRETELQATVFTAHAAHGSMAETPAGAMMLAGKPLNFTQLFQKFVDAYQPLWTWNPRATVSGGAVCDGEGVAGQCASLSRALVLLARAPKPYGLALGAAQVELIKYEGVLNIGFVSDHTQTHFNLNANVLTPGTLANPVVAPLYYWGNHYIVKYLGRYFDPSYSKPADYVEYTLPGDMARYEIIDDGVAHGGFVWEKATARSGRTVYFKRLDNVMVAGRRLPVEGPFDALP